MARSHSIAFLTFILLAVSFSGEVAKAYNCGGLIIPESTVRLAVNSVRRKLLCLDGDFAACDPQIIYKTQISEQLVGRIRPQVEALVGGVLTNRLKPSVADVDTSGLKENPTTCQTIMNPLVQYHDCHPAAVLTSGIMRFVAQSDDRVFAGFNQRGGTDMCMAILGIAKEDQSRIQEGNRSAFLFRMSRDGEQLIFSFGPMERGSRLTLSGPSRLTGKMFSQDEVWEFQDSPTHIGGSKFVTPLSPRTRIADLQVALSTPDLALAYNCSRRRTPSDCRELRKAYAMDSWPSLCQLKAASEGVDGRTLGNMYFCADQNDRILISLIKDRSKADSSQRPELGEVDCSMSTEDLQKKAGPNFKIYVSTGLKIVSGTGAGQAPSYRNSPGSIDLQLTPNPMHSLQIQSPSFGGIGSMSCFF